MSQNPVFNPSRSLDLMIQHGTPAEAFAAKELLREAGYRRALGIGFEALIVKGFELPTFHI